MFRIIDKTGLHNLDPYLQENVFDKISMPVTDIKGSFTAL